MSNSPIKNSLDSMKHYSTYQSQFIEMFGSESNKVLLEDVVFVKDDCRKPINEGVRSEMQEGELYPYYGATGVVDYINDYITDEELLCVAEDCGNYNAGEESAYIIRGKAWVNNHAHIVKMKDSCDIKYLYYYLKIANLMPYVSGTTRLKLTQKKLREIPVVLPTKDKQMAFVAIAEQADKSKFTSLKSQFIEMFGGIQDGSRWPLKSLADLCDLVNGYAFKSTKYSDSGYSIIRIANVQKGIIDDSDKVYYPEVYKDEFLESILNEGDILVSLTGNVGRVGVIEQKHLPAALNQRVQGLRIKDESILNHQYLFSLLNLDDFENLCIKNATGSAQLNLSTIWLRNCRIVCPPIEDQIQFARIAHQADKSKYIN